MTDTEHIIGMLLGTEDDWPRAYETLVRQLGPVTDGAGNTHRLQTKRVTIDFHLEGTALWSHRLVLYYHPRVSARDRVRDDVYCSKPFRSSPWRSTRSTARDAARLKVTETVRCRTRIRWTRPRAYTRSATTATSTSLGEEQLATRCS